MDATQWSCALYILQGEDGAHEIPDVITQCEIEECEVQPDGRLSILCRAEHRVAYSSSWELDGYRMCRIDRVVFDSSCTVQTGMHEQKFRVCSRRGSAHCPAGMTWLLNTRC